MMKLLHLPDLPILSIRHEASTAQSTIGAPHKTKTWPVPEVTVSQIQ